MAGERPGDPPHRPTGKPAVKWSPREQSAGDQAPVAVELSRAQIDAVVCVASTGGVVPLLLSRLPSIRQILESDPVLVTEHRFSGALLSGFLHIACFPADGGWLTNAGLARLAGTSVSTAHLNVSTLVQAGLLERDSVTRRYRLAWRVSHGSPSAGLRGMVSTSAASSSTQDAVRVSLSSEQVRQVLDSMAETAGIAALLLGFIDTPRVLEAAIEQRKQPRLSFSVLTGLLVLAVLPVDGGLVGNTELAGMLRMSQSTTHRYLGTLRVVGLVERDPRTRRYRLAV